MTTIIEKLTDVDIYAFINRSDTSFASRLSLYLDLKEYSIKLSRFALFVTAREDDSIIGVIAYYINREQNVFYIPYVCVDVKHRNQGIAKQLFSCLFQEARIQKKDIMLEVRPDNIGAISLYKKYGFQNIGIVGSKYLMKRNYES